MSGLLDLDYLSQRIVYVPLAEEDDEAGQNEDQDQNPEPQPEFARYRHALPRVCMGVCTVGALPPGIGTRPALCKVFYDGGLTCTKPSSRRAANKR